MAMQDDIPHREQPYPYYERPQRKRTRWWIPLLIFGIIFFGFIFVVVGLVATVATGFQKKTVAVRSKTVLNLSLAEMLNETPSNAPLSFLAKGNDVTFFQVLSAIRRAKDDENIMGIYYRGGNIQAGFAKSIELREALEDFKKSGKFIYAFIETGTERDYFLASVADSVFMPTEGLLELNGFASSVTFYKGLFDKIGVDFFVQQFEEYKSAGEPYTRKNFSQPAREEIRSLLRQRHSIFVKTVSSARHMNEEKVQTALNEGMYSTEALLANGFIDGVIGENTLKDRIRDRINSMIAKSYTKTEKAETNRLENLRLIGLASYIESESGVKSGQKLAKNKEIAIIYGSGPIVSGKNSEASPLAGGDMKIASGSYVNYLRKAREDDDIKAIILRIDSPGGSVIASDEIWEEIRKTRQVKPVYASMSDVAASGGYYMAMACDTIIAHPATITGSIGVVLMIPNLSGTMDKLGLSTDTITTGKSALFMNPMFPFTSADKQRVFTQSEAIYKRFVGRVAESRNKTFEETRAIAKGRVWTGEEAKRVGLVDELGGLQTAIDMTKRRIGVPDGEKVAIVTYPQPEDRMQTLLHMFNLDDEDEASDGDDDFTQAMRELVAKFIEPNSALMKILPNPVKEQLFYALHLSAIGSKEHILMALPFLPEIQ